MVIGIAGTGYRYRSALRGAVVEVAMGDLINLRRARKRREKVTAEQQAEMNRVRFGRTKSERDLEAAKTAQTSKALDQHKLTPGDAT